jgi:hypothetical protein
MKIVPEKEMKLAKGSAKLMETIIGTFALSLVREGIDYEALPLEGKGVLYSIVNEAKKIVTKHVAAMNETLKDTMEMHEGRVFESDLVKITHDAPEPEEVEEVDIEALCPDALGMLVEDGAAQRFESVTHSIDVVALRDAVDRGVVAEGALTAIKTKTIQRAPRIIVSAKGDLKKKLADLKRRALPSGK